MIDQTPQLLSISARDWCDYYSRVASILPARVWLQSTARYRPSAEDDTDPFKEIEKDEEQLEGTDDC